MKNLNRDRSKYARCIRRSRFQLLFLSTAALVTSSFSTLGASEAKQPNDASQAAQLETTPVLKSVGIRFVKDSTADSKSVETALTLAPLANTNAGPSLTIPKFVVSNEMPIEEKASNPTKVIVNTFASVPAVKMPPMIASSEPKIASPAPTSVASIKMELATVSPSIEKPEGHAAQLISSPKPVAALPPERIVASSNPVQDIPPKADAKNSQTTVMEQPEVYPRSEVPALSIASPLALTSPATLPEQPSIPKPEPAHQQLPASVKVPLLAGKKNADEGSRAANVVRIPSMTLSSKRPDAVAVAPSEPAANATVTETHTPSAKAALANEVAVALPAFPMPAMPATPTSSSATDTPRASAVPTTLVAVSLPSEEATHGSLPDLNALPATESLAQKPETPKTPLSLPSVAPGPHSVVNHSVSDRVAMVHQPVRESHRLEPTVVAIPASTRSSESDRSIASGLGTPLPASSQTDQDSQTTAATTSVELMYRDVQSVKTPGSIERVVVDDETVCKAMVSDTNGLILLGLGQGKTQVKVWLAEDNQAGTRLQQIEVTVREPWEVRASQSVASYADATQSLAELFPTARIAIRSNENGSLTIFGKAESDEQAKQIASLVRKMFLVPVQDRIATATAK